MEIYFLCLLFLKDFTTYHILKIYKMIKKLFLNRLIILLIVLKLLDEILNNLKPNKKNVRTCKFGYITATDLADYLVKNHSMTFRNAYKKTAAIINYAEKKKKLKDLHIKELRKIEPKLTIDVLKVFNLKNSINSKKSYGGTSFDNIKKMILKYKKQL